MMKSVTRSPEMSRKLASQGEAVRNGAFVQGRSLPGMMRRQLEDPPKFFMPGAPLGLGRDATNSRLARSGKYAHPGAHGDTAAETGALHRSSAACRDSDHSGRLQHS